MNTMLLRLNRVWRLVMTGLCFALFGLGGLLLSTFWFNVLLIAIWDKARRRRIARRSIAASFRLFLTVAKRLYSSHTTVLSGFCEAARSGLKFLNSIAFYRFGILGPRGCRIGR